MNWPPIFGGCRNGGDYHCQTFPGMEGEAEKAAEQFGDAFRTVLLQMIYGHEGGMTGNTDSLRLLLRGLVLQLFELYDSRKTNRDAELK